MIGGHADHVVDNKIVWMSADLARVTTRGDNFTVDLDGKGEGHYQVNGNIRRSRSDEVNDYFTVRLDNYKAIKEAKVDRGSNSDELFTLAILNPLPGAIQKFRTNPGDDVDSGESRKIDHSFQEVAIPKNSGILTLALSQMESDSEKSSDRDDLLNKFAGEAESETRNVKSEFLRAAGERLAADWKVSAIEVFAFDRRGDYGSYLQAGTVLNETRDFEVEGGESHTLKLNAAAFAPTKVTRKDLLNEFRLSDIVKPNVLIQPPGMIFGNAPKKDDADDGKSKQNVPIIRPGSKVKPAPRKVGPRKVVPR